MCIGCEDPACRESHPFGVRSGELPMTKDEYNEAAALVVRLRKDLELHTDALKQSNAQCAEYLRQNEQLQAAKDEMQNALAEATKDLAYSRLAVDTMCARDKRFTSTAALCGAGANEDIGDFIERTAAERHKLHSELVEVRAALAATTEQRDSLQRTLDEWERADTKPHALIDPPIRMGLISETGPVVFVRIGPKPADDDVADHVVPPVLPLCNVCHGCGSVLYPSPAGDYFGCGDVRCTRSNTKHWHPGCTIGPYAGPCKSATPVRHE